jgi:hypothetical protein
MVIPYGEPFALSGTWGPHMSRFGTAIHPEGEALMKLVAIILCLLAISGATVQAAVEAPEDAIHPLSPGPASCWRPGGG